MSEMIERVAQAILQEQQRNRSAFPSNLDLARAAIEAMREPPEALDAVPLPKQAGMINRAAVPDIWRAWFTAILSR